MQYLVRHLTRFVYTSPVCESVMELRMQPLELEPPALPAVQRSTSPRARVFAYHDHLGNAVHYFDIPAHHTKLDVTIESAVERFSRPSCRRRRSAGDRVDRGRRDGAVARSWIDWLLPSRVHDAAHRRLREFAECASASRARRIR